jgi:inorganic pyrophosphatase
MASMKLRMTFAVVVAAIAPGAAQQPPETLPAPAVTLLHASVKAARPHTGHIWRDTPPTNSDGTVNAYVEIAKGDRRKWEFDMARNERTIDRMIPEEVGGYPVNYGYVPQTVSYDGDPFDALVLGPPLPGGQLVRGLPVGIMFMEDEKGLDSKVVLSTVDGTGRPRHALTASVRREVADYFRRYKRHEPGAFSRVPGWGSPAEGLALIRLTHRFFTDCRGPASSPCVLVR